LKRRNLLPASEEELDLLGRSHEILTRLAALKLDDPVLPRHEANALKLILEEIRVKLRSMRELDS
jgi:hypothetical protein